MVVTHAHHVDGVSVINMEKQIYQLYYSKQDFTVVISKIKGIFEPALRDTIPECGIYRFNECYLFSRERQVLKDYAESMIKVWIEDAEEYLEEIKQVKVQSK